MALSGHAVVDGGVLSNFPIELYLSDEPAVTAVMGDRKSERVLGLMLDDALDVPPIADPAEELSFGLNAASITGPEFSWRNLETVQRGLRLLNTMMTGHDRDVIEAFSHLVAHMPAKGYGTTEFDMSDERRAAIIAAGRTALGAYFDRPQPGMIPLPPAQAAAAQQELQRVADRVATKILE